MGGDGECWLLKQRASTGRALVQKGELCTGARHCCRGRCGMGEGYCADDDECDFGFRCGYDYPGICKGFISDLTFRYKCCIPSTLKLKKYVRPSRMGRALRDERVRRYRKDKMVRREREKRKRKELNKKGKSNKMSKEQESRNRTKGNERGHGRGGKEKSPSRKRRRKIGAKRGKIRNMRIKQKKENYMEKQHLWILIPFPLHFIKTCVPQYTLYIHYIHFGCFSFVTSLGLILVSWSWSDAQVSIVFFKPHCDCWVAS